MASAIDLVIHLGRSEGQRVVRQLAMLERTATGVQMLPAVEFEAGAMREGPGADMLARALSR